MSELHYAKLCPLSFQSHNYCANCKHLKALNIEERLARYGLIFEFSFHFVLKSKNNTLFFIETRNLKKEY